MYNNEPRIFGTIYHHEYYYHFFRDYEKIYEIIRNNLNIPISTINGKNPFDYITDFGKDYLNLKSRQATFIYKFNNNNKYNLYEFPLSIEDLKNFSVVYDNNESFNTDYIILSTNNLDNLNFNLFLNNENNNYKK